jgi:glycosyltransferase involved in cell wall biosynthesis
MPENLKLSIITVNLNNAVGLRKTIESVVNQTYTNFEHIIIDGGSKDGSVDIIKEYQNKITYWISKPDKGIYNAMNKGIEKASGDYLVFLNSGDYYIDSQCIEHFISLNPKEDLLVADDYVEDINGNRKLHTHPDKVDIEFLLAGAFSHAGSFFKKKIFEKERYDESFKIVADYLLYLKLFTKCKCTYKRISKPLTVFTLGGISSNEQMNKIRLEERNLAQRQTIPELYLNTANNLIKYKADTLPLLNSKLVQLAIRTRKLYIKILK